MPSLPLTDFTAKWRASTSTERAASQEHFIDLCRVLDQPTPNEADPTGDFYAFEKGVAKTSGGHGFADVWKRGHFGWEYKGKRKNLTAAYQQLLQYHENLENPPLLVVCDLNRVEVHTKFSATAKRVFAFDLDDLQKNEPTSSTALPPLEVLRAVFTNPARLRPDQTTGHCHTNRSMPHFRGEWIAFWGLALAGLIWKGSPLADVFQLLLGQRDNAHRRPGRDRG